MSRHEEKIARHVRRGLQGRKVTFITHDEASWISLSMLSGNKRHIVSAIVLPCSWCGAEPGERCRNAPMDQKRVGIRHSDGVHGARIKDADLAQHTMETLLDEH